MKKTFSKLKKVAVAAVALFTVSSASAYSVTTGGMIVVGEGLTTSVAGATVVNFNDGLMPSGYSGGAVKLGSSVENWASPPNDSSYFYTVGPGTGQSNPGTVLLNSLSQYFGYFGGSPDTYNSVELYKDTALLATFSGNYLANKAGINPVNGDWNKGAYWNIWAQNSTEYFNKVVFKSTSNAFETDNHASVSAVPLPAAVWLFGTGLLGLLGLAKRQRSTA
jgi:hypothetical protein